jgi:protein tyrosine/serine phosphatase
MDLTEAAEGLSHYEAALVQLAAARGVDCAYRRMPIVDVSTPRSPDKMRDILKQIVNWIDQCRRIYVHCWGGVGRTGTVVGCYLVERGMDGDAALQHLQKLWRSNMTAAKLTRRPYSPETERQCGYVRDWVTNREIASP